MEERSHSYAASVSVEEEIEFEGARSPASERGSEREGERKRESAHATGTVGHLEYMDNDLSFSLISVLDISSLISHCSISLYLYSQNLLSANCG